MFIVLLVMLSLPVDSFFLAPNPYIDLPKSTEVAVITFLPGSYDLRGGEQVKLRWAIQGAKEKGKIGQIAIAAWPDQASGAGSSLPKFDVELASQRIQTLRAFLGREVGRFKYLKTYNLALQDDWDITHQLRSQNRVKQEDAVSDEERNATEDHFLIKNYGAHSKAIVILRLRR